jgi:hypothetical protein
MLGYTTSFVAYVKAIFGGKFSHSRTRREIGLRLVTIKRKEG